MTINYKDYTIEAFEREKDRWRARIRREDGRKIKIAIPSSEQESIETSPDDFTAEAAIERAKEAIDGGGMN